MNLTNKQYDTLKFAALLILPIGTLLATVMGIWEIPHADQIQQTFVALDVFAGVLVQAAKMKYERGNNDGA